MYQKYKTINNKKYANPYNITHCDLQSLRT